VLDGDDSRVVNCPESEPTHAFSAEKAARLDLDPGLNPDLDLDVAERGEPCSGSETETNDT
jgi:hypothetical protein